MKNFKIRKLSIVLLTLVIAIGLNAQVQTQERNVGSFDGINQTISADVFITQGSPQKVLVKADADVINLITTEVENGILRIGSQKSFRSVDVLEVYITMPDLSRINNSGSGDIKVDGDLKGTDVGIDISGSGDLNARLDATNLELKISGSGDVNLSGVRGNFSVSISGSGDVEAENLQLENCTLVSFGSGDIQLKGKAAKLTSKQSGSGDLNAYGLVAVNAILKSNGSGDVVVQVVERLEATLNGSGDLTYYGSPDYVDVESNGSGEVYRKK